MLARKQNLGRTTSGSSSMTPTPSVASSGGTATLTETPVASNSITNKPASAATSLYQTCITCRSRLFRVEGFGKFLDAEAFAEMSYGNVEKRDDGTGPEESADGFGQHLSSRSMIANDPVTQLWQTFRLGAPLCHLYNALNPSKPLEINPAANRQNLNACKQSTARFIMACQQDPVLRDGGLFILAQLYQNDTNGIVQVIRTVEKVLDLLEERGLLAEPSSVTSRDLSAAPKDNRAKVVMELLLTERKYVQDLETLQTYAKELLIQDVLSQDTIHHLFANLNSLLDFQRRFLIGVEANAGLSTESQRFGNLFLQMEDAFSVYEPFCANYAHASDLVITESANLARLAHIMDPNYELPAFLIKPIQRICKYPLLLRELVKYSDRDDPHYAELEKGFASVSRVVDRVNETRRQQENGLIVSDLQQRVEDWKGHSITSFGRLLLEDTFLVSKNESERDYHVYLFERILLCCKEVPLKEGKKKSNDPKAPNTLQRKNTNQKKNGILQLKGRIFMNNVIASVPHTINAGHTLQVYWRGDLEQESFVLKCRNEEQLRQWHAQINKIVDDINLRKTSSQSAPSTFSRRTASSASGRPTQTLQSAYSYQGDRTASASVSGITSPVDSELYDDQDGEDVSIRSRSATPANRFGRGDAMNGRSASIALPQVYPNARGLYTAPNSAGPSNFDSPDMDARSVSSGRTRPKLHAGITNLSLGTDCPDRSSSEESPSNAGGRSSQPRSTFTHSRADNVALPSQNLGMHRNTSGVTGRQTEQRLSGISMDSEGSSGKSRDASFAHGQTHSSATSIASTPAANGWNIDYAKLSLPSPIDGYHPGIPSPIAGSTSSGAGVIKIKVNYGDDIFVIVAPIDTTYEDLSQRVEKKLRLCGGRAPTPMGQNGMGRESSMSNTNTVNPPLRIKYMDEDGDHVTINQDDDVQMAIELSRALGSVVTLYVQ